MAYSGRGNRLLIERVDQLTAPPAIGQFYSVPTVHGKWCGRLRWWVVMGTIHEDAKFFKFDAQHYHLDRRFLPAAHDVGTAMRSPLHRYPLHSDSATELSDIVWRRRKCLRDDTRFPFIDRPPVIALQAALAGAQCAKDSVGWICPHRGFNLGSIAAVDGVILCPLHGLQIMAATGEVVAPRQKEMNLGRVGAK